MRRPNNHHYVNKMFDLEGKVSTQAELARALGIPMLRLKRVLVYCRDLCPEYVHKLPEYKPRLLPFTERALLTFHDYFLMLQYREALPLVRWHRFVWMACAGGTPHHPDAVETRQVLRRITPLCEAVGAPVLDITHSRDRQEYNSAVWNLAVCMGELPCPLADWLRHYRGKYYPSTVRELRDLLLAAHRRMGDLIWEPSGRDDEPPRYGNVKELLRQLMGANDEWTDREYIEALKGSRYQADVSL